MIAESSGVVVNGWAVLLPAVLALFGILGMLWRGARKAVPAIDALLDLKKTTERMDSRAAKADLRAEGMEDQQKEILDHLKVQAARQAALQAEVTELHAYTHTGIHAIRNGLQKLTGADSATSALVEKLGEVAVELRSLPGRDGL